MDRGHRELPYKFAEITHKYGNQVHILADPFLSTHLAHLCSPQVVQPELNRVLGETYKSLGQVVANAELPRVQADIPTRMKAQHEEGVYRGDILDPASKVVLVAMARAGTLPAMDIFSSYTSLLHQENARVDHIFINRSTDEHETVTGAPIHGSKIGGPIHDAYVFFPDPMGATGSSMSNVISLYKEKIKGTPKALVAINLIITPEYIARLLSDHPDVKIYALRLDRGLSSEKALHAVPGEFPSEEKGLNEHQYIVPGAGGFGEISNNSFV